MPAVDWTMVAFGCIGGLLPDILRVIQGRHGAVPAYLKSPMFWISLILLALLGGLAAWLLAASDVKQALAFGFGAPEIISKLLGRLAGGPDRGVDRGDDQAKIGLLDLWSV